MKKIIISLLMTLVSITMSAATYNTLVDGIYYKFNSSDKTATVSWYRYGYEEGENEEGYVSTYSGDVEIKSTVYYQGITYNVTSISEYAFYNCKNLNSVSIPVSITSIGAYAFSGCTSLRSISLPLRLTSLETGVFKGCWRFESITIPYNVTRICGDAFEGCTNLKEIISLPETPPSLGINSFPRYDITLKIQSSALEAYETSLWRNFAYIYSIDLTPNETGKCGENVIYTFIKDTGTLTISGSGEMENYEFGDDEMWDYYDYYMTTPKWYSFRDNISNVVIEPGVTYIGNYAFLDCSQMTSIRIPNSVISIGPKAFVGCSALTSISIPEGTQSVWFTGCTSLSSISLPESITSAIFSDRIINEFSESNIGYQNFNPCKNLETITLPQNISNVEFSGCTSLTSIYIPSSVTSIVEKAFKNCKSLTTIVIPESILNIGSGAFDGCEKLKSIKIPEGVKNIAQKTFYNCEKLGNISLPSTLKSIDGDAFYNCWALKEIISLSTTPPSADITTFTSYDAVLKVPASAVEVYSKTLPWKNFNIIQTLTNDDLNRKCATPTISYNNGNLEFNCKTEGVEFHYNLSAGKSSSLTNSKISLTQNYVISVYASKNGYDDSDPATLEIPHGDINGDGKVDAADTVKLVDLIMKQ